MNLPELSCLRALISFAAFLPLHFFFIERHLVLTPQLDWMLVFFLWLVEQLLYRQYVTITAILIDALICTNVMIVYRELSPKDFFYLRVHPFLNALITSYRSMYLFLHLFYFLSTSTCLSISQ